MVPSIIVTNRLAIERPRPVPPNRRLVEPSACENGIKSRSRCAFSIPIPLSVTEKRKKTDSTARCSTTQRVTTLPLSVNFTALLMRLSKTCLRRFGSPATALGTSGANIGDERKSLAAPARRECRPSLRRWRAGRREPNPVPFCRLRETSGFYHHREKYVAAREQSADAREIPAPREEVKRIHRQQHIKKQRNERDGEPEVHRGTALGAAPQNDERCQGRERCKRSGAGGNDGRVIACDLERGHRRSYRERRRRRAVSGSRR